MHYSIGPRCNVPRCVISIITGASLQCVDTVRYLGVYVIRSRTFKCCIDYAKQSLNRAFNSLYGNIARTASEEVTFSLIKAKCIPCLLYGLEVCPLGIVEMNSIHFAVKSIV